MSERDIEEQAAEQLADHRRTRRNLIAMGGLLASAGLAMSLGATRANAHGRGPGKDGPSGGNACFLAGTRIRTDAGEVEIESLKVGDAVRTVTGETKVVRKIYGWQAARADDEGWAHDVAPVKVVRSALAPNVPERDLYLSPQHALYINGMLIRVGALVNGLSIVRCSNYAAEQLSYFHIELEDHQAILAEGAPAETLWQNGMVAFAPVGIGSGRRSEVASRLRSAIASWIDRRRTFDRVRDHLEARAETELAA